MYNLHMATRERFCRCGKPLEQSQTVEGKPARWPKYCSDACRQAAYREDSPTTVYRLFDADGNLLYVGCTNGVKARFKTHQATKEWWTEVVLADLEHFPNRQQAIAAEAEAIRNEQPKYNAVTPIDVDSSPVGTRLVRIMIQLEPETIEQVDKIRGAVPRAAWVRLLIEDWLNGGVAAAEALQVTSRFAESRLDGDREDRSEDFRTLVHIRDHSNKALGILPDETPTDQASVAQQAEQPAFNRKRAGSNPAGGTGKGSPASGVRAEARGNSPRLDRESPSRPIKKGKACKHEDPIRKLGRPYCTDCGEFV